MVTCYKHRMIRERRLGSPLPSAPFRAGFRRAECVAFVHQKLSDGFMGGKFKQKCPFPQNCEENVCFFKILWMILQQCPTDKSTETIITINALAIMKVREVIFFMRAKHFFG